MVEDLPLQDVKLVDCFFGGWNSPYTDDRTELDPPVGELCLFCNEAIIATDRGGWTSLKGTPQPFHAECQLRSVLGGIAHVKGKCICEGGEDDPDMGLGYRESALQVWDHFINRNLGDL